MFLRVNHRESCRSVIRIIVCRIYQEQPRILLNFPEYNNQNHAEIVCPEIGT